MDSTTTMRVAMRNGTDPNTKINWLGFRCAKSVTEEPSSVRTSQVHYVTSSVESAR